MSRTLRGLTVKELLEELEKRKKVDELRKNVPTRLNKPDWSAVFKMCDTHMQEISRKSYSGDMPLYIYESVMKAVYGETVFEWINECA